MSNLKQPQNLKPFTKFCITIGMLPSSYTIGMTYQEQLIWFCDYLENTVIPAVNKNADALTELQNLFVELKEYVDNYFTNLDIQQEINSKLDEMSSNGTLEEIMKPYFNSLEENYNEFTENINDEFTEFKNTLNTKVNQIDSKVNSVTSGSPIPVDSIGDMTDTTKTYVLTTDGNWYYYNGSSWVSGGAYQSTGLSDNQVKSKNIESLEFEKIGLTNLGFTVDDLTQWNGAGTIIKNDDGSITYNKTVNKSGGVQLKIPTQNKDVYLIIDLSSNYTGELPITLYRALPTLTGLTYVTEGKNIYKLDKEFTNIYNTVVISNDILANFTINSISVFAGTIDEKFVDLNLSEILSNYNSYTSYKDIKNYHDFDVKTLLKWGSVPYVKLTNSKSFTMKGTSAPGNSGMKTHIFTQTNDFLYIKGDLSIPSNSSVQVYLSDEDKVNTFYVLGTYNNESNNFSLKVDLSHYAVYNNIKNYRILFTVNGGFPANEVQINNLELFFGNIEDLPIYADNLNDVIFNIQNNIDTLNSKIENVTSPENILVAPDGKKYQIVVDNSGELYTFPITPTKSLFIGNSLLFGFGNHGMASYDVNTDYYHYVNQAITNINSSYIPNKLLGTDFEGAETLSDVNDFITDKLNPALSADMNLILIQLGDNNNTETKINLLPQSAPLLIQAIKTKCPNARIFWVGCWYSTSQKLQYIQKACLDNNIQFINISALNTQENQAKIGDQYIDEEGEIQTISEAGVASHPSSTGMRAIADTIIPYLNL